MMNFRYALKETVNGLGEEMAWSKSTRAGNT
jgi:hypothetical protein